MKNLHTHNHYVQVDEHRAPTDESIRLFKELQEKAIQSVIKTVEVKQNGIDLAVVYYRDEVVDQKVNFAVKFNINDHLFVGEGSLPFRELSDYPEVVKRKVMSMLGDVVMKALLEYDSARGSFFKDFGLAAGC